MTRFTGLLAIFLTFPFLIASHTPENVIYESGNAAAEASCPSVTMQIHMSSGHTVRTDETGVVGACHNWQAYYNAPSSGGVPVYFHVFEVRSNGTWNPISSAMCGPVQGECGRHWGSVASSSNIVVIGNRPSGGLGGAVVELDTSAW